MLSRRRVNDEGLAFARGLNLSHAESDSLEPPPDLGCAEVDVKPKAFGISHFLFDSLAYGPKIPVG